MTIQQQLTEIVKKEDKKAIISFLKALTNEQRKELVPYIRDLNKEYSAYHIVQDGAYGSWQQKITTSQCTILGLASLVCFSRADFEKTYYTHYVISETVLEQVLPWYCPHWLSDHLNSRVSGDNLPANLNYELVMKLTEKGYLQPGIPLIMRLFPALIYEGNRRAAKYLPGNLLRRPITLQEHFWYIFQAESRVHDVRFLAPANQQNVGWIDTIVKLEQEGKIDRARLLRESLLATNRNFHKNLSGFFADLFTTLQPSTIELLRLQKELWTVLSAPHSKPVNMVLQYSKELIDHVDFDTAGFLDHGAVLLSSTTKSILTATITILEKLANKHPEKQEEICMLLCQAFIHTDAAVQKQAAAVINKHSADQPEALRQVLAAYHDTLLSNTRQLLQPLIDQPAIPSTATEAEQSTPTVIVLTPQQIPVVNSFDDLLFLASQAFENNEPWHFYVLPDALINLQQLVDAGNVYKLEPALQRALSVATKPPTRKTGDLDYMLAIFFIDFCILMERKFPAAAKSFRKVFEKHPQKTGREIVPWLSIKSDAFYVTQLQAQGFYKPCKNLLRLAIKKLHAGNSLPLLSTPTQINGLLDPAILVHRIQQYQLQQTVPDDLDMQLAIMRCDLLPNGISVHRMTENLDPEYKNLLVFLLNQPAPPQGPFYHPAWWMTAALTKDPETAYEQFHNACYRLVRPYMTGQFAWKATNQLHETEFYNYDQGKYEPGTMKYGELKVDIPVFTETPGSADKNAGPLPYELFKDSIDQFSAFTILRIHQQDTLRLLQLMPHHPDFIVGGMIKENLKYARFWEAGNKIAAEKAIEALDKLDGHFGEMGHLLIAVCLLSIDKTLQGMAAGIWIKKVLSNRIDSQKIGRMIGVIEAVEFVPIKRFIDVATGHMQRVSALHNAQLEQLLTACLEQLPEKPIKDLKKLLELYYELLSINSSSITNPVIIQLLTAWQTADAVSKPVNALQKKIA